MNFKCESSERRKRIKGGEIGTGELEHCRAVALWCWGAGEEEGKGEEGVN
jgi:hypothetical protein